MAKSFNTNTAMNWITSDTQGLNTDNTENETQAAEKPSVQTEEKSDQASADTTSEGNKTVTKKESVSSKKSSAPKTDKAASFTIVGKELKTRQTSLLLKESTYNKLEALSKKNNISINSCINQILEQVLA